MNPDATFKTSRTLPHAPAAVYAAFASPSLLAAWWGPQGFTNTFEVFEFRVGGTRVDWTQVFDDGAFAQAMRQVVEPANEQNLDRLAEALGRQAPTAC